MASIKPGRTLTSDDLNVYLYLNGNLTDPYTITYTLKDPDDNIIGIPDSTPIKFAVGSFYVPWEVPDDEPLGVHSVEWTYKETATSAVKTDTEEFTVVPICSGEHLLYPESVLYLIKNLRIKLRDINPDRDYSIAGEELITIDVDGEEMTLPIQELYEIINE